MTFTVFALAALLCVAVVAFARLKPQGLSRRTARRINTYTLVIVALVCFAGVTWMWFSLKGGPDSGWWTALAVIYCLTVVVVALVVASLLRFAIARRSSLPADTFER